ncbi:MFS transporter [Nocardiopsis sp. EMB25]|uniref:MFS transporter n=1 Tax=Nocardiopsis sp. EMB25 TaxID=2835867 RepID=UPI0022839C79|nr:MFS transporter [Nocardiopsis sp. EMB25]MCY9782773.1 MFS transporter [Nocardiopsis sp. EMB25]
MALLVLTALIVLTQLYAAIPLFAPVGAELGGDVTFALATCFSLCYAAGFLIWGPVSDQVGRRKLMVPGLLALSLATLACAFATSVVWLAALRGLQGLAAASFTPVALAYLAEATPPERRHSAIGAMSTAFLVAGIFGQVLASYVSLWFGWPWVFVVCATVLAGSCLTAALTLSEAPRGGVSGHLGHRFAALGRVAVKPSVLALCCSHVTLLLTFVGMYTALGPHVGELGLDPSDVILIRLVGLPGMFAALTVGPLARRWGLNAVARTGFLVAALGLAGEAVLAQSLVGVCAASLVFVVGIAVAVPAMITLFGEAAAPDRAGGMALNGFVLFVGASVGPLAASLTSDFALLLAGFATLLGVSAVLLLASDRLAAKEGDAG